MGSGSLNLRRASDQPGNDQKQSSQNNSLQSFPETYASAAQPALAAWCMSLIPWPNVQLTLPLAGCNNVSEIASLNSDDGSFLRFRYIPRRASM